MHETVAYYANLFQCPQNPCSNLELMLLQWNGSGLTSNPPQGVPIDTIARINLTHRILPEIKRNAATALNLQQLKMLFETADGVNPVRKTTTLLNFVNADLVLNGGSSKIASQMQLNDTGQASLLQAYARLLVGQQPKADLKEIGVMAEVLFPVVDAILDNLIDVLYRNITLKAMQRLTAGKTCQEFFFDGNRKPDQLLVDNAVSLKFVE